MNPSVVVLWFRFGIGLEVWSGVGRLLVVGVFRFFNDRRWLAIHVRLWSLDCWRFLGAVCHFVCCFVVNCCWWIHSVPSFLQVFRDILFKTFIWEEKERRSWFSCLLLDSFMHLYYFRLMSFTSGWGMIYWSVCFGDDLG